MPLAIVSMVNGIVTFPAEPFGYQGLFLSWCHLLPQPRRGGWEALLSEALSFPLSGESKARGAHPSSGFWRREEYNQTKRSWPKEAEKRPCRWAYPHPHSEACVMSLTAQCSVMGAMEWGLSRLGSGPGPQRAFSFRCISKGSQVPLSKLPDSYQLPLVWD